jgi:hypothetical protein
MKTQQPTEENNQKRTSEETLHIFSRLKQNNPTLSFISGFHLTSLFFIFYIDVYV